jgi:hypothetical protein
MLRLRAPRSDATSDTGRARSRITPADFQLLIPFVFYGIGAAGLFRSVYHFHQYAWTLPLVAGLAIDRGGRRYAAAFLLVTAPALALMLRANLMTAPSPDAVVIRPPRGGLLMVSPGEKRRIDMLAEYATVPVPRSLIIMSVGAGFHTLFGTPSPGRQAFYIAGFARGDDANTMLRTLETATSAIVLTDYPSGAVPSADPCTWYGWRHFAAEMCPQLAQRVDVSRAIRVDDATWIIPSAKVGAPPR